MKIKSFGLVEAMIASFIAVTALSAAVALASSINKSMTLNGSYSEAEKIADNFLENLSFVNSQGRVSFQDTPLVNTSSGDTVFSINCFDSLKFADACATTYGAGQYLNFYAPRPSPSDNLTSKINSASPVYYKVLAKATGSDLFGDDFFEINTAVKKLAGGVCQSATGVTIPVDKCRIVDVQIKWSDNSGDKTYKVSRYITDWTR